MVDYEFLHVVVDQACVTHAYAHAHKVHMAVMHAHAYVRDIDMT